MGQRVYLSAVLAVLALAVPAAAQRGFRGGWGLAPRAGFGNVNHPGGVFHTFPGPFHHPFPGVVSPLVSPFPFGAFGSFGFHNRFFFGFGFPGIISVPVAVPVPVGYSGPQQPNVIVIQLPPAQAGPATVVSPPAATSGSQPPVIFNYESPRLPAQPAPSKPLTLLVLKDHTIYAVTDYWVEGERLHFVSSWGDRKSVPLDQLDLEFTRRLNEERNVRFDLGR